MRLEGWAINQAGPGERTEWTVDLSGCPSAPGINNVSAGDGEYTVGWTRPAGSTIWVESNGTIMGPFNDNQSPRDFNGANGTTFTVRIWACNQFGCSTSGTQTVTPAAPTPTLSLGRGANFVGDTCVANSGCLWVQGSGSNWPPGQEYWIQCGSPPFVDTFRDFVINQGEQPGRFATRRVNANGTLSWGENICASSFSHPVRVWTEDGTSVTAQVAEP